MLAAAAVLLFAVPAAARKSSPPDHGFPVDQYVLDVQAGKLFIGGDPPKILGAKTKDAVFVVDDKAHYQPQLGFRRVGRDNGHGKFLVLKARSWTSALAYVLGLDPSIAKYVRLVFPKALFSRPFPPLYAQITYTFEIAADSGAPRYAEVPVASEPHPDPALRKKGAALVTLKRGVTPGTYLVRVKAEVGLAPHPLKQLYEAYGTATGAVEWLSLVGKPAEVVLEKTVEAAVAQLVERAAQGDAAALRLLNGPAYREKIAKKKLESWVKSAIKETGTGAKIVVPTVVPDLTTLNRPRALRKLQERFLRYGWIDDGSRSCGRPPGYVKSQSVKPGTKVKVGTRIRVRVCTKPAPAPKPPTTTQPPPAAQVVTFTNPLLLDRIKILGAPYEPFRVWACNPTKAGSCDKSNPGSDIRTQARAFCQRSAPGGQPGSRIGSDQTYYRLEAPDPGETTTVPAGTKWVAASNGFVSRSAAATVFSLIRCQRT